MSVTDFECAIAKSQIARYIAGENLAPEVSRQLETHIAACPRCKQLLQEKKSSLEAIIEDKTSSEPRTTIQVSSDPVPMTAGNLALNAEPRFQPEQLTASFEETSRLSLREKLREQAQARKEKDNTIDLPAVAPAFAHKDTIQNSGVKVHLEEAAVPKKKKKGFSLQSLALFEKVPVEETKPAMTVENLKSAKEALKTQNSGLKKPVLYLCGLCAVVAAMSFFLKDPTALFGGKAAQQNLLVKDKNPKAETPARKPTKVSKAPAKKLPVADTGTNAEKFSAGAVKKTPVVPGKKLPAIKPISAKTAAKPKPKVAAKPLVKPLPHAPKTLVKARRKPTRKSTVTLHKPGPTDSTVKLYTNETAPAKEKN